MTYFKRLFPAVMVLVLLLSCSSKKQADAGKTTAPATASQVPKISYQSAITAPPLALENADGKRISLSDYQGKVVILNFWATWCGPCRHEIPAFIELQNQYGSKGLQILGVAVDQDGWKAVKPFIAQNGINYPILMYTEDTYNAYQTLLKSDEQGAIPFTFIIAMDGTIRQHLVGSADKAAFEGMIKPLLGS